MMAAVSIAGSMTGIWPLKTEKSYKKGWMQMSIVPGASRNSKFITKNVAVNPRMILSTT